MIKDELERINRIKQIEKLDYIDWNILNELVDVIYISEERGVEVLFKYKNLYEDALRYLNSWKMWYNWLVKFLTKKEWFLWVI
jgi:hypothetical protein